MNNELFKKFHIVILALLTVLLIAESVFIMESYKTNIKLQEEVDEKDMTIQYQKSVIMDLEEDLKEK